MKPFIVFTDLDGTLLDHDTYSFRAALPAVDLLARRGCPVVPVTSKTSSETLVLMKQLKLAGPWIYENGGGVGLPGSAWARETEGAVDEGDQWHVPLGLGIQDIRRHLHDTIAKVSDDVGRRFTFNVSDEFNASVLIIHFTK